MWGIRPTQAIESLMSVGIKLLNPSKKGILFLERPNAIIFTIAAVVQRRSSSP
jgi:hypothetical protein